MYWLPYSSHTCHHPSQTPCLPWISYATQKLMLDRFMQAVISIPYISVAFFPSLKHYFIAYDDASKVSDCIFEIHQLWQSGFSWVYSNCCCSCLFEAKIIKIGQSSYKMYSNNIVTFQEPTTILNAHTKTKSGNLLNAPRINHIFYISTSFSLFVKWFNMRQMYATDSICPSSRKVRLRLIA